jgi:hypothetical protein
MRKFELQFRLHAHNSEDVGTQRYAPLRKALDAPLGFAFAPSLSATVYDGCGVNRKAPRFFWYRSTLMEMAFLQ